MLLSKTKKYLILLIVCNFFFSFSAFSADLSPKTLNRRLQMGRIHECKTSWCGRAKGGTVATGTLRTDSGEKIYIRTYKDKEGGLLKIEIR